MEDKVVRQKGESEGEHACRKALTAIYQKPFPSTRPDFLKSPVTGQNLELDGYNQELGIAFEYNGKQHYEFPNKFHKRKEQFMEQIKRDKWKTEQCNMNGVYLIPVPYFIDRTEIRAFIQKYIPKK